MVLHYFDDGLVLQYFVFAPLVLTISHLEQ